MPLQRKPKSDSALDCLSHDQKTIHTGKKVYSMMTTVLQKC